MSYIEGVDRQQGWLLPERLEDYVSAENPVRFLDAFVDSLDLAALGFQHAVPSDTGRPPYAPGDLLRLYLYGYLNRLRSSRRLEREAQRNVELLWLLRQLRPDFKTIADFRKDNLAALRGVCREFTLLCRQLDLFGGELVAQRWPRSTRRSTATSSNSTPPMPSSRTRHNRPPRSYKKRSRTCSSAGHRTPNAWNSCRPVARRKCR